MSHAEPQPESPIKHAIADVTHTIADATHVIADETAKPRSPIVGVILLPLFFIVVFVMAYISASHAPLPNNFSLTIAGSSGTTSEIASEIDSRASGAFDIERTTATEDAIGQVKDRTAAGAILIENTPNGTVVTSVIASGGGRLAGTTVEDVAKQVAESLGATTAVQDVAPVYSKDSSGTGLFYLLVLCTMGAYLGVSALFRSFPTAKRRSKVLTIIGASALTPILSFSALSFSLGGLGADFGQLVSLLGVAMIYTLVIALIATFFNELIGGASVFAVVLFALAGNLPASGGSVPGSMLPPLWQWINANSFGSAAIETFQSIIYFDGGGFGWPFYRLLIWAGGAAVAVALLFLGKARGRRASLAKAAKTEAEKSKFNTLDEDEIAMAVGSTA